MGCSPAGPISSSGSYSEDKIKKIIIKYSLKF
jgi:hypothetical protein